MLCGRILSRCENGKESEVLRLKTGELLMRLQSGDKRALARLITMVEDKAEGKNAIMSAVYPQTGKAYVIGITGSPGAGKSSLTDCLVKEIRKQGLSVGIIAVDPNSPFSGGAILGDRIRMQDHALDPEVFIRSMSTRGSLGGLSHATNEAIKVMDAFGKDIIIVETVGVGQSELDIMNTADTTLVVLNPGGGDSIQAIKAGIMEIADVFVVNKGDLPGAEKVVGEVETMLHMRPESDWYPSVVMTSAMQKKGFNDLWDKISEHRTYLENSGKLEIVRKERLNNELRDIVEQEICKYVDKIISKEDGAELAVKVMAREVDPYSAAAQLLQNHVKLV